METWGNDGKPNEYDDDNFTLHRYDKDTITVDKQKVGVCVFK